MSTSQHASEVAPGGRFRFGENWARFLRTLIDSRIVTAEQPLQSMLGRTWLADLRIVDVGNGLFRAHGALVLSTRIVGMHDHLRRRPGLQPVRVPPSRAGLIRR